MVNATVYDGVWYVSIRPANMRMVDERRKKVDVCVAGL